MANQPWVDKKRKVGMLRRDLIDTRNRASDKDLVGSLQKAVTRM